MADNFAFLHGGGQGSWVWNETIAALQSQTGNTATVIALDVPGCGTKRSRASEMLDNNDIARELIDDIEQAGLSDVVLVGHSQAGQVLPLMAALKPELFRRLIYVSCSIPLVGQTVLQMMGRGKHDDNDDEVGFPFDPKAEALSERYPLMFCNDMSEQQSADFLGKLGQDS
jgi:pimeloyl-ACP methyl ester carboxylesterase